MAGVEGGESLVLPRPAAAGLRLGLLGAAIARRVGSFLPLIALVLAWEVASRSGVVSSFLLPPLSVVLERVWDDALSGELTINLGMTLYRALAGFAIAAVGGVVLGIVMTRNKLIRWFFRSDCLGRLSDAQDRLLADLHVVARAL
jgi:hypothetical protein